MPITAIGSVGEIRAPNSRQYMSGSWRPASGNTNQIANATTSVDANVPSTASAATGKR